MDQPHPRCAFAGCEMPGEPDRTIPCGYFCVVHAEATRPERLGAFRRAIEEQEERDRNAAP